MGINHSIADRTLEMSAQSRAVLELLAGMEPSFAEFERGAYQFYSYTWAWYNGRERGFVLVASKGIMAKPAIAFVVAEGRNSDSIRVWRWELPSIPAAPPTVEDWTEEVYQSGVFFSAGAIGPAANWIVREMSLFWETHNL